MEAEPPRSLVTSDRLSNLREYAVRYAPVPIGDFWECGIYKGGSAFMLGEVICQSGVPRALHLFDTFEGLPPTGPEDDISLVPGQFDRTSLKQVQEDLAAYDFAVFHKGLIPETFAGLEDHSILFAHVDVDLYQSTKDCLEFIFPRLIHGGVILVDDYHFHPGAKKAVDEFCLPDKALCHLAELPRIRILGDAFEFSPKLQVIVEKLFPLLHMRKKGHV